MQLRNHIFHEQNENSIKISVILKTNEIFILSYSATKEIFTALTKGKGCHFKLALLFAWQTYVQYN